MIRIAHILCILTFLLAAVPAAGASAEASVALPPNCTESPQPDGETYLVCLPDPALWNGDLVVFAHGYVFYNPNDLKPYMPYEQIQITTGTTTVWLPSILNLLGYGFAMSSYRKEGLAVIEGIEDTRNLVSAVKAQAAGLGKKVRNVYAAGASEGGLIATLLMERYGGEFRGGLAVCGPVGDFQKQINYWGDFRAVLDALFPGVLPASAVTIPPELMIDWAKPDPNSTYRNALLSAMTAKPEYTAALLKVTKAAVDPADVAGTTPLTVKGILDYNIFATNEAELELGVEPYSNVGVVYSGSGDLVVDAAINAAVTRYPYVPTKELVDLALTPYQTSGELKAPLVNMHTTLDPIVPFWHQKLYQAKAFAHGSWFKLSTVAIDRYGHCNFNLAEMLYGFFLMVFKANLRPIPLAQYQALMRNPVYGQTYDQILALNAQNVDVTQPANGAIYLPLVRR
ncbi:MAG TPA: hypothetical protein VMT46_13705 [Anaerolineaceae bacterium]|nr:hypothetical protein [Anaerolineaceae bacterium]